MDILWRIEVERMLIKLVIGFQTINFNIKQLHVCIYHLLHVKL